MLLYYKANHQGHWENVTTWQNAYSAMLDKIFGTEWKNQAKLDNTKNPFIPSFASVLIAIATVLFLEGRFWDFDSLFAKIRSLKKSFCNSSDNSYTKFFVLDIKICFVCRERSLCQNLAKSQNIMSRVRVVGAKFTLKKTLEDAGNNVF